MVLARHRKNNGSGRSMPENSKIRGKTKNQTLSGRLALRLGVFA